MQAEEKIKIFFIFTDSKGVNKASYSMHIQDLENNDQSGKQNLSRISF